MFITSVCFVTSCFAGFRHQWSVCFITEPLISFNLNCPWTRPSASAVNWSAPRLPLHPRGRPSCRFVFARSLLTPPWLPAQTSTHSLSFVWLCSCSFLPRGEELSPIITQVSVKWIIGRLVELHDGKHLSWVVWLSVLSPHLHPSADAQGWHVCACSMPLLGKTWVWSAYAVLLKPPQQCRN